MAKRISAFLALTVTLALLLCGCKSRLSESEYYEQLNAGIEEYAAALQEFETVRANVTSSQEIMIEQTKATDICNDAEKALDKFGKMNPPERFSEKHAELIKAVELELKYIQGQKKVLSAKTPDEFMRYSSEAEAVFKDVPGEKQIAAVLRDIFAELKPQT